MQSEVSIASTDNPRVKAAVRLRKRRGRTTQERILIDGAREIARAIEGGVKLLEIFGCEPLSDAEELQGVWQRAAELGITRCRVAKRVFKKLCYGEHDDGLVAVADAPQQRLEKLQPANDAVVAVLVGLEKPGNVGAIFRSADAAGVNAVLLADPQVDLFSPNIIRASLGTVFTMPSAAETSATVLGWLREKKFRIVACRVDAEREYDENLYASPTAVVLGNEATGLPSDWLGDDIVPVCLPMLGRADSLNVSATAAVLLYEVRRQRK